MENGNLTFDQISTLIKEKYDTWKIEYENNQARAEEERVPLEGIFPECTGGAFFN